MSFKLSNGPRLVENHLASVVCRHNAVAGNRRQGIPAASTVPSSWVRRRLMAELVNLLVENHCCPFDLEAQTLRRIFGIGSAKGCEC